MSGHSKWSTIKHKKAATDAAKGKLFSKLAKGLAIAIKTGGGPNPETNYQLRIAIDTAKAANMPKANVDRALAKAEAAGDLLEAMYEGFSPGGAGILVEVATDNKNRTAQEIKHAFERGGGQFAGPGAVSFNFERKGMLVVEIKGDKDTQMLDLIDAGAEEIEESDGLFEAYVDAQNTSTVKADVESKGYVVKEAGIVQKPKSLTEVTDPKQAQKALSLLETLEDHDDVQNVYTNLDVDDSVLTAN